MNRTVETHPDYERLRPWLTAMADEFATGRLLYEGRNEVRLFERDGLQLVVKRFKRHDWLKRIVYTWFRENKALRAFRNARQIGARGFQTPHEVAYIEERSCGLIRQVYYVCLYTAYAPIRRQLIEQEPFSRPLATAYAQYVARLHDAGVLHRDLNPTNVLFSERGGTYDFCLIDINRMRFYDGAVPKAECMENLTLFWWLSPVYRYVLDEYAARRHWTDADISEAIDVKRRHDRAWVRRKRMTHPLTYRK